jgi:hypothetical protein
MEGKCMKPRKQNNENKIKKGKKASGIQLERAMETTRYFC